MAWDPTANSWQVQQLLREHAALRALAVQLQQEHAHLRAALDAVRVYLAQAMSLTGIDDPGQAVAQLIADREAAQAAYDLLTATLDTTTTRYPVQEIVIPESEIVLCTSVPSSTPPPEPSSDSSPSPSPSAPSSSPPPSSPTADSDF